MYEGDFKKNMMQGKGDFTGYDGYKYTGGWVENKQQG